MGTTSFLEGEDHTEIVTDKRMMHRVHTRVTGAMLDGGKGSPRLAEMHRFGKMKRRCPETSPSGSLQSVWCKILKSEILVKLFLGKFLWDNSVDVSVDVGRNQTFSKTPNS